MQISKEDLEDFKKRYKKAFGKKLSDSEASEAAHNLLELYAFLARPLPSEMNAGEPNSHTKPQKTDAPSHS